MPKLSQDGFQPEGDVPGDVFEEHPFGGAFPDDAGNVGPEVTRITGTAAFAGGAEGLAGIAGQHRIERAPEGPGVETAQIGPDWRWFKVSRALGRDEHRTGPFVPFDEGAAVIAGLGEHEAHIQASAACAEGESVPGT